MALTFIGVRGSGKSAVGAAVAARLGRPFADADAEIERRAGQTIREIFAAEGEAAFREIERQVMAELLDNGGLVIAAGGGAVLSVETREQMRRSGPVVYLRVTPETAERRITTCATTADRRPALTGLPLRAEIETVMAVREPLYRETATVVVDTEGLTVDEIAGVVCNALPAGCAGGTAT
jgi:shikimate kinase